MLQAVEFFRQINPIDFLTGTVWSASIQPFRFGVIPLVVGTLDVAVIALLVAIPLGLLAAVYLAEYASVRTRNDRQADARDDRRDPDDRPRVLRPELHHAAGPQAALRLDARDVQRALSGGLVVGLLITPLIASLSEDAMRAVPRGLREGAFAMGATKFEVVRKVVFPAALSGIMASIILAMSRAIGETMAVVLAVGMNPQLSVDPRQSVETMTAFIVQISRGDTPQGSVQFKSLFAVALVLFAMTFVLNLDEQPDRRAVPEPLLMSGHRSCPRPSRLPRFDPQLARRKLSGTIFLGACMLSIGILLLTLLVLLIDVFTKGLPWLDTDFLTGTPSRIAPSCRHPAGARRLARDRPHRRRDLTFPIGVAAAIYLEEYAEDTLRQPAAPYEHLQPGRRAFDHLRHLRPGPLRPCCSDSATRSWRARSPSSCSSCRS